MTRTDNLYRLTSLPLSEELITVLFQSKAIRIERIVSTGQVSGWYDQEENEFVCLLQGEAEPPGRMVPLRNWLLGIPQLFHSINVIG